MEQPKVFHVLSNVQNTHDIFTLELTAPDESPFEFLPGQCNMLYLFGHGEIPLSICSHPDTKEKLQHTIKAIGPVTEGLGKLKKGDAVGVRGPFGTSWPLNEKVKDILFIGGGVALPPLRTAMYHFIKQRSKYEHVTFLYGARTPQDILFKSELEGWREHGIDVEISVDRGDDSWKGPVCVVTKLINSHVYNPESTLVFLCGPEIMMHFAIKELEAKQVSEGNIYLSMERNMQCGVGFCGHCQFGPYFICKDGPIFPYTKVKKWLTIKEL